MDKLKERVSPLPAAAYVMFAAAAVVIIGLLSVYLMSGDSSSEDPAGAADHVVQSGGGMSIPDYVSAAPEDVRMAYQFAVDRPDVLMWMPCYCGCGGHAGHKSAKNCFVKEGSTRADPQFDEHGANCDMCVSIVLDTKAMTEEGRSLSEIRTYIDATYSSIGPGTDTPLPPG